MSYEPERPVEVPHGPMFDGYATAMMAVLFVFGLFCGIHLVCYVLEKNGRYLGLDDAGQMTCVMDAGPGRHTDSYAACDSSVFVKPGEDAGECGVPYVSIYRDFDDFDAGPEPHVSMTEFAVSMGQWRAHAAQGETSFWTLADGGVGFRIRPVHGLYVEVAP